MNREHRTNLAEAVAPLSPEEIFLLNLQRLMQKETLTEAELARRTKIPQPTMHKLLSGRTEDPRISTLQSIASYFGITVDELYSVSPQLKEKETGQLNAQSIPIISWESCLKGLNYLVGLTPTTWSQWTVVEHTGKHLYGLTTKPAMEPKFSKGSVLIVDAHAAPRDGDIIVVHYPNTPEATLREIIIDGPSRCLTSIQDIQNKSKEELTENVVILGSVIESRFGF